MFALLLKLLDPRASLDASSQILIDGVPLHLVDRATLRQRLIAIPQDAVFLPDGSTFEQNLDPYSTANDAECLEVLQAVDLWTSIESRGGLKAEMTSQAFSHGQRQLFSLARAILRRRVRSRRSNSEEHRGGVLLLDEVTSSVDQATEQRMQALIRIEFQQWTILAISHRLDMIVDFDKVVVMDRGEVVEVGRPAHLIEIEGTRFGNLWKAGRG